MNVDTLPRLPKGWGERWSSGPGPSGTGRTDAHARLFRWHLRNWADTSGGISSSGLSTDWFDGHRVDDSFADWLADGAGEELVTYELVGSAIFLWTTSDGGGTLRALLAPGIKGPGRTATLRGYPVVTEIRIEPGTVETDCDASTGWFLMTAPYAVTGSRADFRGALEEVYTAEWTAGFKFGITDGSGATSNGDVTGSINMSRGIFTWGTPTEFVESFGQGAEDETDCSTWELAYAEWFQEAIQTPSRPADAALVSEAQVGGWGGSGCDLDPLGEWLAGLDPGAVFASFLDGIAELCRGVPIDCADLPGGIDTDDTQETTGS